MPPEAAEAAGDSVGAAMYVATQLLAEAGNALVEASHLAFMDGLGVAVVVAAAAAFIGAVVVHRYLPADHEPLESEALGADESDPALPVS